MRKVPLSTADLRRVFHWEAMPHGSDTGHTQAAPKRPHKCPVCHGVGSVPQGFYNQLGLSTSTARERCLACGGNGIIVA